MKTLNDLFLAQLRDIYYGEQQSLKAFPRMIATASDGELRDAFESHSAETKIHVTRLEEVFANLSERAQGQKCEAIDEILEEGKEIMDYSGEASIDSSLICAGQTLERYEIAMYDCLCAWARHMAYDEIVELLEQTLEEEKLMDYKLAQIAECLSNLEAAHSMAV
jgi:ferritin-like metal-binding protein YciE